MTVYEATAAIPKLGIEPGDLVTVDLDDHDHPVRVTHRLRRTDLQMAAVFRVRMEVVSGEGDPLLDIAAGRIRLD